MGKKKTESQKKPLANRAERIAPDSLRAEYSDGFPAFLALAISLIVLIGIGCIVKANRNHARAAERPVKDERRERSLTEYEREAIDLRHHMEFEAAWKVFKALSPDTVVKCYQDGCEKESYLGDWAREDEQYGLHLLCPHCRYAETPCPFLVPDDPRRPQVPAFTGTQWSRLHAHPGRLESPRIRYNDSECGRVHRESDADLASKCGP